MARACLAASGACAGAFLYGRGHPARSGTGLLSRPASNAPARDDTHPAAWNVPVGSESLLNTGAQTLDDAPESARSVAEGPYSLFEARSRRRAGSVARAYGVAGGGGMRWRRSPGLVARAYGAVGGRQGAFATETWGSCPHTRSDGWGWGASVACPGSVVRAQGVTGGRGVRWRRIPRSAVRARGVAGRRQRIASRRARPAASPG